MNSCEFLLITNETLLFISTVNIGSWLVLVFFATSMSNAMINVLDSIHIQCGHDIEKYLQNKQEIVLKQDHL